MKVLMTQQEIATAIGCYQSHVHYMLNGDRSISIDNAMKFEQATGICREGWLFPERHWNPYMPFTKNSSRCGSCPNRITRIKKQHELCLDLFKKA